MKKPWAALALIALIVAGQGAIGGAGGGCSRPSPPAAHPALFVVRDSDTTVWLLGTIHLLPAGTRWQTPMIKQAVSSADTLVTEIPPLAPAAATAIFVAMGRAHGLAPLAMRVGPARAKMLASAAAAAGISIDELAGMKNWAAALTLSAALARSTGATAQDAPEAVLATRFRGRRHLAFETLAGQLALFDALAPHDQLALLDAAATGAAQYRQALIAWRTGDMAAITRSTTPLARSAPAAERSLLVERNGRWSGWIAARMAQPGKILVAVGAGHLAGPRSIIAMLRARGLSVARVE